MCFLGLGPGLIGIYGFFVEPLSREFGVGAAIINIGSVALLLVGSLAAPLAGRLADRLPIRRLLLIGVTVSMCALLAVSRAPSLWLALLGFLLFAAGLALYGPVVVNGLMVKLYPGREARALSVAAIGISVASVTLPPLLGLLLASYDWRSSLAILAVGALLLLWAVALKALPAGVVGSAAVDGAAGGGGFYRQRAFWLIGIAMALGLNVAVVLTVSYPLHFSVRGFSVAEAGWFLSIAGLSGLTGKLLLASLGDALRQHARWLAAGVILGQVAGLCLLLAAREHAFVVLAMMLTGFSTGAFLPMHAYLNSRHFDASVIGSVTGAQMPLFLPFGLIGAPLAGYVYDRTGSYDPVLLALAAVLVVAALLVCCLPHEDSR